MKTLKTLSNNSLELVLILAQTTLTVAEKQGLKGLAKVQIEHIKRLKAQ
jgi:hypothetical protein